MEPHTPEDFPPTGMSRKRIRLFSLITFVHVSRTKTNRKRSFVKLNLFRVFFLSGHEQLLENNFLKWCHVFNLVKHIR